MQLKTEYLIVGAGVAGCALAWQLSQAGRDVLVLELRDAATKNKLCAGALGVPALEELELLCGTDIQQELELFSPTDIKNRCFDKEHSGSVAFVTTPRKDFDAWLLKRCQAAGAHARDLTRITSINEQHHRVVCTDLRTQDVLEIRYDQLIGADSAASTVRRLLTGRHQRVAISLEGSVAPLRCDIVFDYHPARLGYCWYIPNNSEAKVGCMLHDATAQDCRTWLSSFCNKLGIEVPSLRGAPIPSGDDVLLHPGKDVWLVGDAAGLIWPTNGGGIHYALESARALASSLLGGTPYEEALESTLKSIAQNAANKEQQYFLQALSIAKFGRTVQ